MREFVGGKAKGFFGTEDGKWAVDNSSSTNRTSMHQCSTTMTLKTIFGHGSTFLVQKGRLAISGNKFSPEFSISEVYVPEETADLLRFADRFSQRERPQQHIS